MIKPKLVMAINGWASSDPQPMHAWLHPWIPLFATELTELFSDIRRKIGANIRADNVCSREALAIVRPWVSVFDPSNTQDLLARSVIPKLAEAARGISIALNIDGSITGRERLAGLVQWYGVVPTTQLASVLSDEFFPQWIIALVKLISESDDLDAIGEWYLAWKGCLPMPLLETEIAVRAPFEVALDMMERATRIQEGLCG